MAILRFYKKVKCRMRQCLVKTAVRPNQVLLGYFVHSWHMFFIYIVLCPNPDRFVYYLCIQNYNTVFTLMARAILFYNTYISSGDSNFLIKLTVHSLMNYIHCEHCKHSERTLFLYRIKMCHQQGVHIRGFMLMQPKLHHEVLMQVTLDRTCTPVKKARA
jgi:hypothetical protein